MRASWTCNRRGLGALVALVMWVLALALVWALVQSQATSNALTGAVRVSALTTLTLAAESALDEASIALRHPPDSGSPALAAMLAGRDAGEAQDPRATRELFADDVAAGTLDVGRVEYRVIHRGAPSAGPGKRAGTWLIDLAVRVRFRAGGVAMTRRVRRRHAARLCEVRALSGRQQDKVVYSALAVQAPSLMQVIEP